MCSEKGGGRERRVYEYLNKWTMQLSLNYHNSGQYSWSCLYLEQNVSKIEFCLRLKVEPTTLNPIDTDKW
jgi:hypothetical protein